MREKVILERFEANRRWVEILQNRITKLEQDNKIEISRPLNRKELNDLNYTLNAIPTMHIDKYPLKEIIQLMLDRSNLELKRVPEKAQLLLRKGKK